MQRTRFRIILYLLLALSVAFAALSRLLPYEWGPDAGARFRIATATVKRDRSNYWVMLHLRSAGDLPHDFLKPVRLVLADGSELEPADTSLGEGMKEMWFKFWLESADLEKPLSLKINDGLLEVKSSPTTPRIADGMTRTFTTHRW